MFGWLQRIKNAIQDPEIVLKIEQGKGGKFRWYAYRVNRKWKKENGFLEKHPMTDSTLVAQAPIAGFDTSEECRKEAQAVLKGDPEVTSTSWSPDNREAW